MAIEAAITGADEFYVGEHKPLTFTVYGPDATDAQIAAGTATPQDISGWALSWRLKRSVDDPDTRTIATKTTGAGIVLTTPASGLCTVTVTAADTLRLPAGQYVHELKRTDSGFEAVLAHGPVTLLQGAHRS